MVSTAALSLEEVCRAIESWRAGAMSDLEMHLWATNNHRPARQQLAPGKADHAALAIGITLAEFKRARPPYRFHRDVADFALALIGAQAPEFEQRKNDFFKSLSLGKGAR